MSTPAPSLPRSMTGRQRFNAAIRCRPVDRPPVWFMRQAGRHLPEYRAVREQHGFLDICYQPDVCAEVTLQPFRRYGVDAAIVFNDILTPLADMGMGLDFQPGPQFDRLIDSTDAVAALATPRYEVEPPAVEKAIATIRAQVGDEAAVLGFIGAPFTVASYAVAGPSSQRITNIADVLADAANPKREVMTAMEDRLVEVLAQYAAAQVRAGADAIQIFESAAGDIDFTTYARTGLRTLTLIVERFRELCPDTPMTVFGRDFWPVVAPIGLTRYEPMAISLDWHRPLGEARRVLGQNTIALQGNLDPATTTLEPPAAADATRTLLGQWRSICAARLEDPTSPTGWIVNLGHGMPRDANPESVQAIVDAVRAFAMD